LRERLRASRIAHCAESAVSCRQDRLPDEAAPANLAMKQYTPNRVARERHAPSLANQARNHRRVGRGQKEWPGMAAGVRMMERIIRVRMSF